MVNLKVCESTTLGKILTLIEIYITFIRSNFCKTLNICQTRLTTILFKPIIIIIVIPGLRVLCLLTKRLERNMFTQFTFFKRKHILIFLWPVIPVVPIPIVRVFGIRWASEKSCDTSASSKFFQFSHTIMSAYI